MYGKTIDGTIVRVKREKCNCRMSNGIFGTSSGICEVYELGSGKNNYESIIFKNRNYK